MCFDYLFKIGSYLVLHVGLMRWFIMHFHTCILHILGLNVELGSLYDVRFEFDGKLLRAKRLGLIGLSFWFFTLICWVGYFLSQDGLSSCFIETHLIQTILSSLITLEDEISLSFFFRKLKDPHNWVVDALCHCQWRIPVQFWCIIFTLLSMSLSHLERCGVKGYCILLCMSWVWSIWLAFGAQRCGVWWFWSG